MPNNRDFYIKLGLGVLVTIGLLTARYFELISDENVIVIATAFFNFILGLSTKYNNGDNQEPENLEDTMRIDP